MTWCNVYVPIWKTEYMIIALVNDIAIFTKYIWIPIYLDLPSTSTTYMQQAKIDQVPGLHISLDVKVYHM